MYRRFSVFTLLACLASNPGANADPIHAVNGGGYWHHDSHWVFPERIGEFVRVGIPQDVAGSEDAVAHYAWIENGIRNTASVDVFRTSSAAADGHAQAAGQLSSEGAFRLSDAQALAGTRQIYTSGVTETPALTGVYSMIAGEWRVTIRIHASRIETMDAFVSGQRWDTLTDH
ncbi:MAG TPA: hypothetical protein VFS58_09960 [Steroidobacteraceae bacterium]|nr:hypothetical protein [Steroidobacteraceae bacterium]